MVSEAYRCSTSHGFFYSEYLRMEMRLLSAGLSSLNQTAPCIYWNNITSTNAHHSIAVVVQFPLNYPVTRYLMACKMTDYRQQYLTSRIHECSNCGRMVKLTTEQTWFVFVRASKIHWNIENKGGDLVPFQCAQGGYLKINAKKCALSGYQNQSQHQL